MPYEKTLKSNQVKPNVASLVIAKGSKGVVLKSKNSTALGILVLWV